MNELTKQGIELALDESEEEYINNTKEEWTPTGVRDAKVEGVLKVVRLTVEEMQKIIDNLYYAHEKGNISTTGFRNGIQTTINKQFPVFSGVKK